MSKTALGIFFILSLYVLSGPVHAEASAIEPDKLSRLEISPFLGKWEGYFEHFQKQVRVSRNVKMDVRKVEGDGYRATVFVGPVNTNPSLLGTARPVEKECKVKFARKGKAPIMKLKMGHWQYELVLRGEELSGECTSAQTRSFSLYRPK